MLILQGICLKVFLSDVSSKFNAIKKLLPALNNAFFLLQHVAAEYIE